MLNTSQLFLNQ